MKWKLLIQIYFILCEHVKQKVFINRFTLMPLTMVCAIKLHTLISWIWIFSNGPNSNISCLVWTYKTKKSSLISLLLCLWPWYVPSNYIHLIGLEFSLMDPYIINKPSKFQTCFVDAQYMCVDLHKNSSWQHIWMLLVK